MNDTEERAYRRALGGFATGVAIVTAGDAAGGYSAITINSFASVSLRPRIVLWSLGRDSDRYEAFAAAPTFGITILGAGQIDLARRFSQHNVSAIEAALIEAREGAPLLRAGAARLACRQAEGRVVGDHLIVFGEVLAFDADEAAAPLLYSRGLYRGVGEALA